MAWFLISFATVLLSAVIGGLAAVVAVEVVDLWEDS